MKRRLQFIPVLLLTLLFTLAGGAFQPTFARAQGRELAVLVDGLPVTFDVQPVIQEGRTLVPFRALAAALNVEVSWDGSTQTVRAAGQGI
ncbi:MAG: copper amine oxidase N-terminal domain-containing protein, partial [Moorella sp. (in: Bacteria)]|nr:copper amine oxidase N-terminal domain-containing protein [Moorella sp. (in: firmicutes)]